MLLIGQLILAHVLLSVVLLVLLAALVRPKNIRKGLEP